MFIVTDMGLHAVTVSWFIIKLSFHVLHYKHGKLVISDELEKMQTEARNAHSKILCQYLLTEKRKITKDISYDKGTLPKIRNRDITNTEKHC
jgi:hypothetical protein